MSGNVHEIYSVQGTQFQTTEIKRAFDRAKTEAIKIKSSVQVLLNNNPAYLIDRTGKLIAA